MTSQTDGQPGGIGGSENALAGRVLRGGVVATLGEVGNRVIAVGSTFVLAGILGPFEFGVMSAALLASSTIDLAFTTGLGPAVQMHQHHGEALDRTALTFGLLLGTAVAVAVVAVAEPIASLVGVPAAAGPVRAIALVAPLGRWADVRRGMSLRDLSFGLTASISVVSGLVGAFVAVVLAINGAGYWSLVWQYLALQVSSAALFTAFGPRTRKPGWDTRASRILLRHSREFVINAIVVFAYNNLDDAAVSRTAGATALGEYSLGYRIASLPATVFANALHQVMLPAYLLNGAQQSPTHGQVAMYERATRLSIVVGGGLAGAIALFGPSGLELVYGGRWSGAYPIVRWLALFGAARAIGSVAGTVFYALDRLSMVRWVSVTQASLIAVASWPAARTVGAEGVAAVVAATFVVSAAGAHVLATRLLNPAAGPLWLVRQVCSAALPCVAGAAASVWFAIARPTWPTVVCGVVVHFAAVAVMTQLVLSRDVSEVRQYLGRGRRHESA